MEKFDIDFSSKKFTILLIVVCVVFFVIVIKAFEYLPDTQTNNYIETNNSMINSTYNENAENNDQKISEETEKKTEKTLNISLPLRVDDIELEEIDSPEKVEIIPPPTKLGSGTNSFENNSKKDSVQDIVTRAKNYKNNAQYINALEEYKSAIELSDDKEIKAQCYEEIALIYGIARRYGTALSYAIKSYNMSPSSYREMLLARLYYKTGDIEKATSRINNILRREFSEDR